MNRRSHHSIALTFAVAVITTIVGCARMGGGQAAPANAPATSPADSSSAHRAALGFLAAFDSLQWEPFRSYFADDVTMFFPFAQVPQRANGRAAVENVFNQFMTAQRDARTKAGRPMVQGLQPRDVAVQMAGPDAAVVSFHLGNAQSPARRSIVFRRTGGAWKVIHWHASSAPPSSSGGGR